MHILDIWVRTGLCFLFHLGQRNTSFPLRFKPNRAPVLIFGTESALDAHKLKPCTHEHLIEPLLPLDCFVGDLRLHLGGAPDVFGQIRDEEEEEPILIEEDDLNELLMWIVDEKYEKVLYKAIRYTEDDEQKKHPMPYLYMSKAYMGIHNSDDPDCASPSKWTS